MRPHGTPRLPSWARSTDSARGCCARTRWRRGSIPASRSSTRAWRDACVSWRSRRRCGSSSPASAARRWTCLRPTASTACARCSSRRTESCAAEASDCRGCRSRTRTPRTPRARARCWTSCCTASASPTSSSRALAGRSTSTIWSCSRPSCSRSATACAPAWSERFELLMVDEFQDTNPRQLGILAALDRGNLFTVGDELQSIYGFRHADVSLFRARHAELEEMGGSVRLTRNFRSREPLLDVVNAVFAQRFSAYTPLVAGRSDASPELEAEVEIEVERRAQAMPGPGSVAEPEVELLLTDIRGWEEREDLRRGDRRGTAPRAALASGGGADAGSAGGRAGARATRAGRRGRGAAARGRRPRGVRARAAAAAACARWRPSAASGGTSRSATCSPTCARSPTRWTSARCTRRWPRRWRAARATAWRCSPTPPVRAGGGAWETALAAVGDGD